MICSEAQFDIKEKPPNQPSFQYFSAPTIGDASESALIKFYQPIEDIGITRSYYPLAKCKDGSDSKLQFNSINKYALSIVRSEGLGYYYVVNIKGAPERIWKFCSRIMEEGRIR